MRVTPCQTALAAAIALNLLLLLGAWWRGDTPLWGGPGGKGGAAPPFCRPPRPPPGITVLLADFDDFENDVVGTSRSFASLPAPVLVVTAEAAPYPPLPLPPGVRLLALRPLPERPPPLGRPELHVRTRHVALVPDGARAAPGLLERMRDALEEEDEDGDGDNGGGDVRVVALPVGPTPPRCLELRVEVREWTARYSPGTPVFCGALEGAAVLLLRTRDLFALPFPFTQPLPTAIFIQAAVRRWRLRLLPASFPAAPRLVSPRARWKNEDLREKRRRRLLGELGIKLEVLADGGERWHGCGKDTARCFGTVYSRTPQYLAAGRWTPPCCLKALRETARHVVGILESSGIRYWLEGGSLLGAARAGDIIPWDYDVDVGIYREDAARCRWLAALAGGAGAVEDAAGFLWEKAAEGDFYRVHYSRSNRLHVDLWPFYARGGVMTKDTWLGHPQDVEFPERFLLPRLPIAFAGFSAMAPHNPREFLEFKFGAGVIENPEYPNPAV
ncbi:FKRP protein, partial [Podargus strigoides]|nr:FKRP protein [Podargus strigoides]